MTLDFSRCRDVWVPNDSDAGGFWNPPFEHIKIGVKEIIDHPYFLLADDMGLGKTAEAIIAAQFLSETGVIDRVIVIAPAEVRRTVWYDQQIGQLMEQLWYGKRSKVTEYHQDVKSWIHEPDGANELRWIISNYEYVRRTEHLNVLLNYCGPKTLLIFDESSAVRGYDSKQTQACMKLRWQTRIVKVRGVRKEYIRFGVPRCGRILLLNGTPVADSPLDMFSQGNLMSPSILDCRFVTEYKSRYAMEEPVLTYNGEALTKVVGRGPHAKEVVIQHTTGWKNLDDLQRRFAPYVLRRESKDVGIDFALPPVGLEFRLTDYTWRIYKDMRDEMIAWLMSGDVAVTQTAAVRSMRLSQITSGFVGGVEEGNLGEDFDPFGYVSDDMDTPEVPHKTVKVQEIGRERLDFALEWQSELLKRYPDLKLLTWCRFIPELQRYLTEVQRFGHPIGAVCGQPMLGGRKKDERAEAMRLLHPKTAPTGPVTVGGTFGTGALGLNFTACHTVLDMSYDFSPWKKKQGDARVNRTGQKHMVNYFYLIATGPKGQATIDKHIMLNRLGKMQINDLTVAGWVKLLKEE